MALERFLSIPGSWLIAPTSTMAGHVRNQLARASVPVRPSRVMTLAQFLDRANGVPGAASPALVHFLIEGALERLRPARFEAVARYRGVHQAIADLIGETPGDELPADLAGLAEEVERELRARGLALRNARLAAAESVQVLPPHVVFDGFFSLSAGERKLIQAISRRACVTVALAELDSETRFEGFVERRFQGAHRTARTTAFSAPTLEREAGEIARRILEQAARGRAFREMGVIVRVREPYASALATTFARFGIPARLYFADPAIHHSVIAYLAAVVKAMLGGWDRAGLLAAVRMPVSGIGATPAGDRLDFEMRELLPASGLPLPEPLAALEQFDAWRRDRITPAEWAARVKSLRDIVPEVPEPGGLAALNAFDAILDQTAAMLDGAKTIALASFWRQAERALSLEHLRAPDRRRNVVHVMDVFEARQWELPLVFVCGMMERHFPQYHRPNPLLGPSPAGAAWHERQEGFLFELAITRATEETVLSYARFSDKGEEMLPSCFLRGHDVAPCDTRVRPRPARLVATLPPPRIQDDALLARLAQSHRKLAATSIESFLQCPFQFFASKTLRLRPRPLAPRDRLDVRVEGSILHRALAEIVRAPLLGASVFDQIFADECRRARIPATYRTEAVRLELLRHIEAFIADRQVSLNWPSRVEEKFSYSLTPLLAITGRIDRLDAGPRDQALVIDYKHSAPKKIRDLIKEHAAGERVQGGLYLAAARKQFGLEPAGMLYCGLRGEVAWDGWHIAIAGLEAAGESTTKARLEELISSAEATAMETFESITSGRIAPQPADPKKCAWCDYRDICRVETAAIARKAAPWS